MAFPLFGFSVAGPIAGTFTSGTWGLGTSLFGLPAFGVPAAILVVGAFLLPKALKSFLLLPTLIIGPPGWLLWTVLVALPP